MIHRYEQIEKLARQTAEEEQRLKALFAEKTVANAAERKKLIKLAHKLYVLHCLGVADVDSERIEEPLRLAGQLLDRAIEHTAVKTKRQADALRREYARIHLVEQHAQAWNMAQSYFEKANKILCQMLASVTDELLQKTAGISVLYEDAGHREDYLSLVSELEDLNRELERSYRFLYAYDVCVKELAEFTGVTEYKLLPKESERLKCSGLIHKITRGIKLLQENSGTGVVYLDCVPHPMVYESCYETAVQRAAGRYGDRIAVMEEFSGFLLLVDALAVEGQDNLTEGVE